MIGVPIPGLRLVSESNARDHWRKHQRIVEGRMRSGYSRGAQGRRADLADRYFRSSWEANYARFLNFQVKHGLISSWDYECKTFIFETIKRGTRSYLPDFLVTFHDGRQEWHEVKGWMDQKSKTRLARMARHYPNEVVRVIGPEWFKTANKGGLAAFIPGWERGGRRGIGHELRGQR